MPKLPAAGCLVHEYRCMEPLRSVPEPDKTAAGDLGELAQSLEGLVVVAVAIVLWRRHIAVLEIVRLKR